MLRTIVRLRYPCSWICSSCESTRLTATGWSVDVERKKMINKLLYRSKQRGFLELDLLVGLWAEREIPKMDTQMLQQFAVVLDQENPDLFKWLTGQLQAPQVMQQNQAYQALSQHVAAQLAANSQHKAQAAAGKEWVRGWDDYNKVNAGGSEVKSAEA